jgi:hypothetical protein
MMPLALLEWPRDVYRRYSVDIHVPDWDPQLLGRFNAAEFVGAIARGGLKSFLMYTNSHVGLCLWRTKVGHRHAALKDRDFFGEVVAECRKRDVHPLAYFSLIHDNWNYEHHPDWRITPAGGNNAQLEGRYGVVCPNSPYREYALSCVREIVSGYDIDGLFCDMTFWPAVCYCAHCTARFLKEHGAEPPRIVDWEDPLWRKFQKARQAWLLEFAMDVTAAAKKIKPITVNHQYSTVFHNWTMGTPLELARACDYVGGDFYGGPERHSLACKLYQGMSRTRPFEFHTSRTRDFTNHVTVKPMEELRTESYVATLHSAALMLVDYINADGTLNAQVYEFLRGLSEQRAAYEPFLGGDLLADVAIYYDKESMYNPAEKGVHITKLQAVDGCPHRDAVVGVARILQAAHIPFGLITNANLEQLNRYRAVILPYVLEMTAEQAALFREFVARGGALYSSSPSPLLDDILGIARIGKFGSRTNFLTPRDPALAKAIWPQDHLSYGGPTKARALPGAEVLATVTLPFVDPALGRVIGSHFAAIHSHPPALTPGTDPAVVLKGRTVWAATPLETSAEAVNAKLFLALLGRILPRPYHLEVDTHPAVEATLFHQPEKKRLLIGLLNLQRQLPQVPVPANVRVGIPAGKRARRVLQLPDQTTVPFEAAEGRVAFRVPPFDTFAMRLVEYE